MNGMTAAHKTLPFNTRVRVVNLDNGKVVAVRINDRGPFVKGRIIDLSRKAASKIGMLNAGLANVRLEILSAVRQ
jgi:rare lipoprotein A